MARGPRYDANLHATRTAAEALVARTEAPAHALDVSADHPRFGTDAQHRFLWTVVAHGFDPRCAAHIGAAFGTRSGLTIGQHALLWGLADAEVEDVLGIVALDHPLHALGLLVPEDDRALGVGMAWRAPPRAWNHLRGEAALDPIVARYGGVARADVSTIESSAQRETRERIAGWLANTEPATLIVSGSTGGGRTTAIARAVAPRPVVFADFRRVPGKLAAEVVIAVQREAALQEALPVLTNLDALWSTLESTPEVKLVVATLIAQTRGPLVITTGTTGIELDVADRTTIRHEWPLPDATARQTLWRAALTSGDRPLTLSDAELAQVASRYAFGAGAVAAATRSARRHADGHARTAPSFEDIVAGVRDNIAERLGEVARRVEVTQSWDELVLTPDTRDDVTALVNRVKFAHRVLDTWGFRAKLARGTGTAALFSGPPGTGKTMVAGLIARELQLDLYQIDLSKIVSKWVGETEKQLAKVFEAAEAGHALLLFDEADALFAKRSAEVKSAVDRYANLEVNYLLQRVESFGGVVILTTNLDASIDPALRRRLAAHITFGAPESDERLRLWKQMLPTRAEVAGDLELDELVHEFEDMSGGNIRNAVLAAAFLAAGEDLPISAEHLRRGARGEYRAMGRVLTRGKTR